MNPRPINVLFLNDHLGFEGGAIHGPARYFQNILGRFDPSLVKAKLCILRDWHPFAGQLRSEGIEVFFLSRSKWNPWATADLLNLIRREEIDILHLAGMKGTMIGRIASRVSEIPAILHFRDMNPQPFVVTFLQKRLSSWTDFALAVSNPIRSFAIEEFGIPPERIEVIRNPVPKHVLDDSRDFRAEIRAEFGIPAATKVIAIIGRLSPEKGHALLIRAMPRIISELGQAVLLVVGEGPTRSECVSLVAELGLGDAVRFAGHRSDVPQILAAVDAVAMPSEREGFPNTALESLAAGKPIVGFSVGGLPEVVIDHETGFLSPPGDIEGLIGSLVKILSDDALAAKMASDCVAHADLFSVANHVQRLEQLYRELLDRASSARAARDPSNPNSERNSQCG